MSNKNIAINWAIKTVKKASGFVYSDQFFQPFSNPETRDKIEGELLANNIVVWSDQYGGAFLFNKNDPRLTISNHGQLKGAVWIDGDNVLVLPSMLN